MESKAMVNHWASVCRDCAGKVARSALRILGQCWLCGQSDPIYAGCCNTCFADLPRPPPVSLRPRSADDHCQVWLAALYYQVPVDTWVYQFKFRAQPSLARHLAVLIAAQVLVYHKQQRKPLPRLLVPVPMPLQRWQQRGYNQALLLCRELSLLLGVPCVNVLCLREDANREPRIQHQLSRSQRQQRMATRYRCNTVIGGGHIAVVDDVITSGSTVNAAAVALLDAGADEVSGWALAYTPAE